MLYVLLHKDKIIGLYSDLKKCQLTMKGLVSNEFTTMKMLKIVSYYENSLTICSNTICSNTICSNTICSNTICSNKEDSIIENFTDESTTNTEENKEDKEEKEEKEEKERKKKEKKDRKKEKKDKKKEKKEKEKEKLVLTDELDSDTKTKINKERQKKSKIEYNMTLLKQKKEKIEESKTIFNSDLNLYKKFKKILVGKPLFIVPELFQNKFNIMLKLENDNNLNWESFNNIYEKETINTSYTKLFGIENYKEKQLIEVSSEENN